MEMSSTSMGSPAPTKTGEPPTGEAGEGEKTEYMQIPRRVYLPIHMLPSVIPSYQRLLDAPYKWRLVIVKIPDEFYIYYLTDLVDLVYIQRNEYEKCVFYHKTKGGAVYSIPIGKEELPKKLSQYTDHIFVRIDEEKNLEGKWKYTVRVTDLAIHPILKDFDRSIEMERNLVGIDDYHIFFINFFFKHISRATTQT